jgi:hypothetical protein
MVGLHSKSCGRLTVVEVGYTANSHIGYGRRRGYIVETLTVNYRRIN